MSSWTKGALPGSVAWYYSEGERYHMYIGTNKIASTNSEGSNTLTPTPLSLTPTHTLSHSHSLSLTLSHSLLLTPTQTHPFHSLPLTPTLSHSLSLSPTHTHSHSLNFEPLCEQLVEQLLLNFDLGHINYHVVLCHHV